MYGWNDVSQVLFQCGDVIMHSNLYPVMLLQLQNLPRAQARAHLSRLVIRWEKCREDR
jgi:hypothetical protein